MTAIPVIDLFAGPGGLSEGFASYRNASRRPGFTIALSIEKDPRAHETLTLRSFYRRLSLKDRKVYWSHLRGEISREQLFTEHRRQADAAKRECVLLELAPESAAEVRQRVHTLVPKTKQWVLIGGPPCQAYSLAGRSRNRGNPGYEPAKDHRQTLYVEYLQILADHQPTVFVMENVKGLLSATLPSHRLFDRIRDDLANPGAALIREGRKARSKPRYELFAIAADSRTGFTNGPADYVVKSEAYGIPQSRHRVIILGVLENAVDNVPDCLTVSHRKPTVRDAISDLPRLRGGITDCSDDPATWRGIMAAMSSQPWVQDTSVELRRRIRWQAADVTFPKADRGADFLGVAMLGKPILNHSSRGHIRADLERYFFASMFAQLYERSPTLGEFPRSLLPLHENISRALTDGLFHDRFRVQVKHRPASTITSHISKDGHYYIHFDPSQCRSLTVREAARLQTFADDYFFCGPRTSQYQQVGNAVPPRLARQIARIVYRLLS